jgi:ATP-dependent DNA ligase
MGSLGKHIGDVTLMCESDYGSNRAKPRIALEGYPSVWVFDMRSSLTKNMGLISRKKEVAKFLSDIRNDGRYRLRPLEYQTFDRTTPELLMGIMRRRVAEGEEGVVIKYPFDSVLDMETWLKRKKEVEVDMVCMGFNESDADWHAIDWDKLGMDGPPDSMVGAIIGGLYKEDGKLHPACLVGAMELDLRIDAAVNPNKFIGKVFVAKGFEWFSKTGSLRHPSFIRWRDDKPATECNMKQKPRLIL